MKFEEANYIISECKSRKTLKELHLYTSARDEFDLVMSTNVCRMCNHRGICELTSKDVVQCKFLEVTV